MKNKNSYKVVTLTPEKLARACSELEDAVVVSGFSPEAVLTIATGGDYVGELMFKNVPHFSTKAQRPTTKYKKGIFRRFLKILPRCIKDRLRIVEARRLSGAPKVTPQVNLPELPKEGHVLIVDDAVDSGATLAAVCRKVAVIYPGLAIRTAVITATTDAPLLEPDYCLYRNSTLIRFPWSADY